MNRQLRIPRVLCSIPKLLLFGLAVAAPVLESARAAQVRADTPTAGLQLDFKGEMLAVSYAGIDLVVGAQFYFADAGWKTMFGVAARDFRRTVKHGGMRAAAEGTEDGIAAYAVRLGLTRDRLEIEFEYDVPTDSEVRFAVCDLFLSGPLFLEARRTGPKGETSGEFHAFGPVEQVSFDTRVGQISWAFGTERVGEGQASSWVLRDTRGQKWRPDSMKTFSFLNNFTKPQGTRLQEKMRAVLGVVPRPFLAASLEASGLLRVLERLGERPSQLRNDLGRIAQGDVGDPEQAGHTLDGAEAVATTLTQVLSPSVTEPVVIPQPQEMVRTEGQFVVDRDAVIVVPSGATSDEGRGPAILNEELKDYFGLEVPVVTAGRVPAGKRGIVIGTVGRSPLLGGAASGIKTTDPGAEGYVLHVTPERILVVGCDVRGAFYGVQTLHQLLSRTEDGQVVVPCLKIRDWPEMKMRGMMIIPGRRDIDYFKRAVRRVIARHKCNTIIIGEAGMGFIRWQSHPEIAVDDAWTPQQLAECVQYARDHFLDVIPLVQCMGHCRHVIANHPEWAEVQGQGNAMCLSNPSVRGFLTDVYEEVLDIFKPSIFHIGGDEAAPIGVCERCKSTPAHRLVGDHVTFLHDWLAERGVKTMMWHDMLLARETWGGTAPANSGKKSGHYGAVTHPAVDALPKDIIMAVWIYRDQEEFPALPHFQKLGFPVVACPWYRKSNNYWYGQRAKEAGALGLIGTSWMFTSWRSLNMMTLLSMEYAWTPGTPKWGELPYVPEQRMQQAMSPPLPSMAARERAPLDIRPWCNRSLRDEVAGDGEGWMDEGPLHDLRLMPGLGRCIAAAGRDLKRTGIPTEVKGIAIGRKAKSLIFLHTSSFTNGGELGAYVIHYADGSEVQVVLKERINIGPTEKPKRFSRSWKKAMYSGYLTEAKRAWVGLNLAGEEIDVQAMEWANPRPDSVIESVDVRVTSHNRGAMVFVLAITTVM